MTRNSRIGIQIIPSDPFWVQVGIAIDRQAYTMGFDLIRFDINNLELPATSFMGLVEEMVAAEIDALIILDLPEVLIQLILDQKIPVIALAEQLNFAARPEAVGRISSPQGLRNVVRLMSQFLLANLPERATMVVIGGLTLAMSGIEGVGEDGRVMLDTLKEDFEPYPSIQIKHIPTSWSYKWARPQINEAMQQLERPPDVIFGLSDTLALAGRAVAAELGLLTPQTLVVGISGDPEALAAIAEGKMAASVEISAVYLANRVVALALQAASGQALPRFFDQQITLITAENIADLAKQKLIAIAEIPNHLVGFNRWRDQQHVYQLETNLAINRQIGAILDRDQLMQTVEDLIRAHYHYDRVNLYLWSETDNTLLRIGPNKLPERINPDESEVLTQVLKESVPVFVPDMRTSQRFKPDPRWPEARSRVVLPVRFGEIILGVLDLQHHQNHQHEREQLLGLQLLADQVAIAIRNAELYSEALEARKAAEKADKLKTQLLANVSHEFRTPLNIILGYSKAAQNVPNPYGVELPGELSADLSRIYRSGEHLAHLVNDLLDLSRAEIDELEIFPEIIEVRPFLEEVFQSVAELTGGLKAVRWYFEVPATLPLLQADPVRLRQVLLNLLSNATKFTRQGEITLGAEVRPPYVHIWVRDTGTGISPDQQEQIFEPFTVGENHDQDRLAGGIGLGLTITRHLVTLHRGSISVESEPGKGSTFHVYLPLPSLSGQLMLMPPVAGQERLNLVYISNRPDFPAEVAALGQQPAIQLSRLRPAEVGDRLLELHPAILAWNFSDLQEVDWPVLDYLRKTPQLARLPLLLFESDTGAAGQNGSTNILLKPFSGKTLQLLLETHRPRQSRGKVLLVDDDPASLSFYQQMVESALPGLTIYRAENGQKALDLLRTVVPDLVIIDMVMPEVGGLEVVEWLRTNPPTRNVPVILVSGKVLSAESIEKLEYARVVFNSKNILNSDETAGILQKALEGNTLLSQNNSLVVKRAVAFLQRNYIRPISLDEIAREVGISKKRLEINFQQELGISPWEYLTRYRIKEAKDLLKTTDLPITEVAGQIGFDDPAYFSRLFRSHTGQSPKDYRNS